MTAERTERLYNRFDIVRTVQSSGNVTLLEAVDTLTGTPVRIHRWTPATGDLAACRERLAAVGEDGVAELFSDQTSCYAVLPVDADPLPILVRLREQQLFVDGAPETVVLRGPAPGPAPDPEPTKKSTPDPVPGDKTTPADTRQPDSRQSERWQIIAAVIVLAAILAAAVFASMYKSQQEAVAAAKTEAAQAAQKAQERDAALQRARDEALKKAQEAEEKSKKLQRELEAANSRPAPVEPPHLPIPQPVAPVAPRPMIEFPAASLKGSWFTSLARTARIARQKVLVFPSVDAARTYFQSDADWKRGPMAMTSVTSAANNQVVTVLSEQGSGVDQSYRSGATVPLDWIRQQWADNYRITTLARVGTSWWVVTTKNTDLVQQVILGPSKEWPAQDIDRQYARTDAAMRITEVAYQPTLTDHEIVVVMSSTSSGRLKKQRWVRGWNQTQIEAALKDGFMFVQAIRVAQEWYVVLTDNGEQGTWQFIDDGEFPRDGVQQLAAKGYRIGWLW